MALTAVPGGAVRVPFRRAHDRPSIMPLRDAGLAFVDVVRGRPVPPEAATGVALAVPPDDETSPRRAGDPSGDTTPPADSTTHPPPPPPPMVIVHRRPGAPSPGTARRGERRRGFGDDPLEDGNAPRALRRAIDDLLGDIEERRDDRRDDERR